jgi:amidase
LPSQLIVAVDAFGFADAEVAAALRPMVDRLAGLIGSVRDELMAPQGLSVWSRVQRTLQPVEAWQTFRPWVERDNPRMAFNVARGLIAGSEIGEAEREWAELMRQEARARMAHLLSSGTIVCLPTTPFPAPKKGLPLSVLKGLRARISCLCSHGGLTGVPQINLPGAEIGGLPIGLSIIGGHGTDVTLVSVARAMAG